MSDPIQRLKCGEIYFLSIGKYAFSCKLCGKDDIDGFDMFDEHTTRCSAIQDAARGFQRYEIDVAKLTFSTDIEGSASGSQSAEPKRTKPRSKRSLYSLECRICHKFLSSNRSRIDHENTHAGRRPYVCVVCAKSFTSQSALGNHVKQVHINDRPHKCLSCGKRYNFRAILERHIGSVHLKMANQRWYLDV